MYHICDDFAYFILSSVSYGNHGCNGGNMYNAYKYIVANNGVDTQSSYPFQGRVRERKRALYKFSEKL